MRLLHQHIEALDETIILFELFHKHAKEDVIRTYYTYLITQLTTVQDLLQSCKTDTFELLKHHFDQETPN
ncbi:hypothetical protein ES703_56541 [subsurface metagenome]